MDVAISKNGARILRVFFFLVVVFLYAPILILLIFSFNDSMLNAEWVGFTLDWYRKLMSNAEMLKAALAEYTEGDRGETGVPVEKVVETPRTCRRP